LRVTPAPDFKRHQQHLSPPLSDGRALQGGLAGLGEGAFKDDDVGIIIVLPNVIF
jgi:hypothetical protein